MKWIKDFVDGDQIYGLLLVVSVTKGVTDGKGAYLNVVMQDKTGTIDAKVWNVTPEIQSALVPGKVVNVEGTINLYKGNNQLKILSASPVYDDSTINLQDFMRVSPIPLDELKARLDAYLKSFKDKDVELITKTVINHFYEKYISYPGAVRIHHEFGSGILHHSLAMADLADDIAKRYPQVDRDILVAGALLHDIGKTIEYTSPLAPQVTTEGRLVGHISIMYGEFKKIVDELNIKSEVPLLLEHMILSHHGTLEFGSPVLPATREALLLSMIDLLDSRMMILDKAYENTKPGEFTQRLWAMDDTMFYKPKDR